MFRINYTNLNKSEVEKLIGDAPEPTCISQPSGCLIGKEFTIILDKTPVEGPRLEYEFVSENQLLLKENGADAVACSYCAFNLG